MFADSVCFATLTCAYCCLGFLLPFDDTLEESDTDSVVLRAEFLHLFEIKGPAQFDALAVSALRRFWRRRLISCRRSATYEVLRVLDYNYLHRVFESKN